jgi:hypothetical protein
MQAASELTDMFAFKTISKDFAINKATMMNFVPEMELASGPELARVSGAEWAQVSGSE